MLTVILTSYSRPRFVRWTLDSLIAQTCLDWRCLVMDDGSDGETLDVLAEFAARDERISVQTAPVKPGEREASTRYAVLINRVLPTLQDGLVGYLCDNVEYRPRLVRAVTEFFESNPHAFVGYVRHRRDVWTLDGKLYLGSARAFGHWDETPSYPGVALSGDVYGLLDHSQVFHRLPVEERWDEQPEARIKGDGLFFTKLAARRGPIHPIETAEALTLEHLVK